MNKTVLIAGLGLIGGSIAKAIGLTDEYHVIGFDVDEHTVNYALKEQIIDEIAHDFEEGVKKSSIIFLAAPISETILLMKKINHIKFDENVIVTDVSSVKGSIMEVARESSNKQVIFIGGHPMAGSHKTGIEAARAHLFENARYIFTPVEKEHEQYIAILKDVLRETKSTFLTLSHEEHDEMTSVISHFPHLIASSLVHQAKKWEQVHHYLPELAAGGFRDITRIASSNPKMWQDIFAHNGNKLSQLLQYWIYEMVTLKEFLDKDNREAMNEYLENAKQYRDGLGDKQVGGAIPAFYDLFVDIKDQPGAIASVSTLLANEAISIRNIRILEIREDISGALRLSVTSKSDQEKAMKLLQNHGYEVMISN